MKTKPLTAFLATIVGLGVTICPAFAQDWTGPYIGGSVNYAKVAEDIETLTFDTDQDGNYGNTVRTTSGANAFSPGFCGGLAKGTTPAQGCEKDEKKAGYGLRAGYDWQTGHYVYGVVGEVSSLKLSDSVSGFSTTPAVYSFTHEIDTLYALRGRVGIAFGGTLVYATGGYAAAEFERSFSTSNALNSFKPTDGKDGQGYQVGFGIEKKLGSRWSLGFEYLRTSLEGKGGSVRAGPGQTFATNPFLIVNATGTDIKRSDDRFKNDAIAVTLSYRFGAM